MLQEASMRCSTTAARPRHPGRPQASAESCRNAQGKQGRFRQNCSAKRVELFRPSVIVVGPELQAASVRPAEEAWRWSCSAVHLFAARRQRPVHHGEAGQEARGEGEAEVWDILDEVIREHPVMLNRAPTCTASAFRPSSGADRGQGDPASPAGLRRFKADFDGEPDGVHIRCRSKRSLRRAC